MKQNKIPRNEYIIKPKGKTNPYKHDVDYRSKMGYRDDSPYNQNAYNDIHTPNGMIDMSQTGIPLFANGQYLPEYSGMHYLGSPIVREIPANHFPIARYGGSSDMYPFGGIHTKTDTHMATGGWLDNYQDGGKIDMSKVKMNYFPKSNVEAQSRLDEEKAWENAYYKQQDKDYQNEINAAVKKGIPRKQAEVVIKKYKSEPQEQNTVVAHTPQSKISKALEVATNPVLAMKNYKGHRLPDNFSSNAEEDLFSPSSVSNLGYQFLSLPGKMAFATSSGDEAVKNVKDKDYLMAGVNAAFSAPVFSPLKGLNKLKKSGTLNKASKLLNAAPENNFTYKGVIEPFKGSTALTKEEANAYYDFLKERQNPYLAGQWKNEYKEFKKQYPVTSKSSTGIIEKPTDPEYYKNFLVNGKSIPKNKKGGQKGLKSFTSKNVFSSINDIMLRNEKVFGPAGKRRFKPGLKYKDGGWLDNMY